MLLKKNIPLSYMVSQVKVELLLVILYAGVVTFLYHKFNVSGWTVPLSIPMIMGIVISLLLAFRSNQAYDRWWEARTVWGAIVNDSRTFARQVNTFISNQYSETEVPGNEVYFFKEKLIKRQIAWCYSVRNQLRNHESMLGAEKFISRKDLMHIKNYNNTPMALLELHGYDLKQALNNGWINQFQHIEMDETLTRMCDEMGKCERIKNTVFPATYSVYIHFSLIVFFILMPFAMIEYISYLTVPAMVAIAASFFLIEKMAVNLQDPFENRPTDTPMSGICFKIERDLKQMINEEPAIVTPVIQKKKALFYEL